MTDVYNSILFVIFLLCRWQIFKWGLLWKCCHAMSMSFFWQLKNARANLLLQFEVQSLCTVVCLIILLTKTNIHSNLIATALYHKCSFATVVHASDIHSITPFLTAFILFKISFITIVAQLKYSLLQCSIISSYMTQ